MHVRRSFLNWGFFLVCLGAVPLAVQAGPLDRETAATLVRLWPLILVGIGLGLLLRFTRAEALGGLVVAGTFGLLLGVLFAGGFPSAGVACGDSAVQGTPTSRTGTLEAGQRVTMELSCANVSVARGPGNAWAAEVISPADRSWTATAEGGRLRLSSDASQFPFGSARQGWRVTLPGESPLDLSVTLNATSGTFRLGEGKLISLNSTLNASDATIDLRGVEPGTSANIDATLNASSVKLTLPNVAVNANITTNASSLELCVAPETGLRISYDDTLSSHNFAAAGMVQSGKTWQSANYAAASVRTELDLSANVSSATLNPVGGCE